MITLAALQRMPTGALLLIALLALAAACSAPKKRGAPGKNVPAPITTTEADVEEIRFKGKISNIHLGAQYDGHNTITVDGKKVIFGSGGDQGFTQNVVWGKMDGIKISGATSGENISDYNGKSAEVYCRIEYASGPQMEKIPIYTLYGDEKYYVKLAFSLGW